MYNMESGNHNLKIKFQFSIHLQSLLKIFHGLKDYDTHFGDIEV